VQPPDPEEQQDPNLLAQLPGKRQPHLHGGIRSVSAREISIIAQGLQKYLNVT